MTYEQYIDKLCDLLANRGYKKELLKKMPNVKIEKLAKKKKVIPKTNFTEWCLKNYGYAIAWKGARNK